MEITAQLILFLGLLWIPLLVVVYQNIRYKYRTSKHSYGQIRMMNIIYFLGMVLVAIILRNSDLSLISYMISELDGLLLVQVGVFLVIMVILYNIGYSRITAYIVLNGLAIAGLLFLCLIIVGLRPPTFFSYDKAFISINNLLLAGFILLIVTRKVNFYIYGNIPPLPTHVMNLRITLAAMKILFKELGVGSVLRLLPGLVKAQKKGEPWEGLPEPEEEKDKLSRALIGDAVILYRLLKQTMPQEKAEEVIKAVIMESAIAQLYSLIPKLKREEIEKHTPEEMETILTDIVTKFPNTDWHLLEATETSFAFRITRCRLMDLVLQLEHPELAGAFCPGDKTYFERYQTDIEFIRPATLGNGQEHCDFIFKLKTDPTETDGEQNEGKREEKA